MNYLSPKALEIEPYTPGEQPRDRKYIKLNTNENAYPPSPRVKAAISGLADSLRLYPDPDCGALRAAIARRIGALRQHVKVSVPYAEGAVLSLIHDGGQVVNEDYTADGTVVECYLDAALCQRVEKMLKNGHVEAVGSAE